jgi:DNA-binding NarL/FixJ family response regulator
MPPERPPLRVVVLADDPLARAGLVAVLADATELVVAGQADLGADGGAALAYCEPDVAVVDLGWDAATGRAALAELAATMPVLALVAVAEAAPPLAEPVRGLVPRAAPADELLAAVLAVAAGLRVLGSGFDAGGRGQDSAATDAPDLTPRELEVLRLMAEGLPNKAIAHALGISEHTAKFHAASVLGKLAAQSRTEAVMRAARLGLVAV